jgi:hypothetical protein
VVDGIDAVLRQAVGFGVGLRRDDVAVLNVKMREAGVLASEPEVVAGAVDGVDDVAVESGGGDGRGLAVEKPVEAAGGGADPCMTIWTYIDGAADGCGIGGVSDEGAVAETLDSLGRADPEVSLAVFVERSNGVGGGGVAGDGEASRSRG